MFQLQKEGKEVKNINPIRIQDGIHTIEISQKTGGYHYIKNVVAPLFDYAHHTNDENLIHVLKSDKVKLNELFEVNYNFKDGITMRKVLYTKYNSLRKPDYQVSTSIVRDGNEKYAIKKPQCKKALGHIETIKNNYNTIRKIYTKINPVKYTEEDNGLVFPFVTGTNLLNSIDFNSNNMKSLIESISSAISDVLDIKEEYRVPFSVTDEFRELFKDNSPEEGIPAFSFSNLDCIISNFVRVNNTLFCIDYEWCLNFPVPIDYLKYRILSNLYSEKKDYFADKCDVDEFIGYFGISKELQELYFEMEECFQDYVFHIWFYLKC